MFHVEHLEECSMELSPHAGRNITHASVKFYTKVGLTYTGREVLCYEVAPPPFDKRLASSRKSSHSWSDHLLRTVLYYSFAIFRDAGEVKRWDL